MHIEPGLSRLIQSHSRREGGCGELGKPIRSDERCPQPFELQIQMRCSLSVRDVKRRGAAQNPRANPHGHLALGSSGARTVVWWLFRPACFMPMHPESKIRTAHSPITSEFPSSRLQRTACFQHTQVSRSARRRLTSRLHERARHVFPQGTVHSSLIIMEDAFSKKAIFGLRSQRRSCISRILIDAAPWREQWGVRHDLYARIRESPFAHRLRELAGDRVKQGVSF